MCSKPALGSLTASLCLMLNIGCASTSTGPTKSISPSTQSFAVHDPVQGFNQRSFVVSETSDKYVLRPIARGYGAILPKPIRTGVTNFFGNLRGIDSALNGFLQGKPRSGFTDLSRVLVNSTLGLGGLFDPATRAGLEFQDEDFGQTLAVWGYRESAYIYLPVVGPSTVRDLPNLLFRVLWPNWLLGEFYHPGVTGLDVISAREQALQLTAARDATALSPYVFTREAYYQRRRFQIFDGDPPEADKFDEFEDLDEFDDENSADE